MRSRTVGINVRVSVTEKRKMTLVAKTLWAIALQISVQAGAGV